MHKLIDSYRQKSIRRCLGLLGLLLVLPFVQGFAQSTQGSIVGTVTDSAGGVVPGALVTLTNAEEGTVRTTKSNGVGDYRFEDVKAGHYSAEVTAGNFERWRQGGNLAKIQQSGETFNG